jgi:hypothetical protein
MQEDVHHAESDLKIAFCVELMKRNINHDIISKLCHITVIN